MAGADVLIASNRGPLSFRRDPDGAVVAARGGGGLVSAMTTAAAGDGALWLCASLSEFDREVAAAAPEGRIDVAGYDTGGAAVAMLVIDEPTLAGAYTSISNATLWRLHHGLVDPAHLPIFDDTWRRDWAAYRDYNERFAAAIAAAANPSARVLVQDYHLTLAPAMIRARRPDLRISHFTHTPWASPEVFALLPDDVAAAIVTGLIGADVVGFHSPRWAAEFAACAAEAVNAPSGAGVLAAGDRSVLVRVYPLGVDPGPLLERAAEPDVAEAQQQLRAEVGTARIIGRVDRTEPAKNVQVGLLAFADLLDRWPEHREQVIHVVLAYPSRQDVAEYRDYTELCQQTAAEINARFATPQWQPINFEVRDDYPRSLATLRSCDVMLINPLRDGMNLVAKEGALLSHDAVLVLSREAGAADQMGEYALLVDPADVSGTAEALAAALAMPADERARRHRGLREIAAALPPHAWLERQLADLAAATADS